MGIIIQPHSPLNDDAGYILEGKNSRLQAPCSYLNPLAKAVRIQVVIMSNRQRKPRFCVALIYLARRVPCLSLKLNRLAPWVCCNRTLHIVALRCRARHLTKAKDILLYHIQIYPNKVARFGPSPKEA